MREISIGKVCKGVPSFITLRQARGDCDGKIEQFSVKNPNYIRFDTVCLRSRLKVDEAQLLDLKLV